MQKGIILIAAVFVTCATALPQTRLINANRWNNPRPKGNELLLDAQVGSVLRNAPLGSQLYRTVPAIPALLSRLPDNATLIRPNIVDNFKCEGRDYGYYGDVDNECQIFHVCLPLQQLYPLNFTSPITYTFSFICPDQTIFSQDAMVCAWESEALPCNFAPDLYWMNKNFFRLVPDTEKGFGERYANLNEPQR
ncbi:uncharacterized protein LOC135199241 [Macrobrachium nipponense]|uniref:uncharacterized protein LOC135199241 n=1 Tax=Macrobrachium nipponense TaxID=159736 RepID=UPI0030C8CF6C